MSTAAIASSIIEAPFHSATATVLVDIEESAILAAYHQSEKHGLEFGRLCHQYRQTHSAQGSRGKGLAQILRKLGIKEGKAYYWIAEYEISVGSRSVKPEGIASSCPTCGDEFPSKSQLKKHQRKFHPALFAAPSHPVEDYSQHPELQAMVGGRSHGMGLERLRKIAADLGLDAHVSYDDGFKVTKDGETESFETESATRDFLRKAQRPSAVPEDPIIELHENMRVRYDGAIYRVSQKSGVPALTLVGSDEVAA